MVNSLHPTNWLQFLVLGYILAAVIAGLAYKSKALDRSGAIAATFVGGTILGCGGWLWGGVLITFFLTSTLLGKVRKLVKGRQTYSTPSDTNFIEPQKGGRRDAMQVIANGGIAALCAIVYAVGMLVYGRRDPLFFALFLASLSTANGDTWATEIGSVIGGTPRLIISGRPVPAGTSGAVSVVGTLAAASGSLLISLFGLQYGFRFAALVFCCGCAGVLVDSLLGGTLQAQRIDPVTGNYTEDIKPGVRPDKGFMWLRNDQVNLVSIMCAALMALILNSKI
jgi:uncharacterized protein (TIGR00297 family)